MPSILATLTKSSQSLKPSTAKTKPSSICSIPAISKIDNIIKIDFRATISTLSLPFVCSFHLLVYCALTELKRIRLESMIDSVESDSLAIVKVRDGHNKQYIYK